MISLLPIELHHYSIMDVIRGFMAAGKPRLNKKAIELPSLGQGIPIRSARAAIVILIKALDIAPGSRIGVPLHCCPVVFKAIKVAKCHPRFLDIDPKTFCISPEDLFAKRSDIDALVAVHMFGNMCDMEKMQDAMSGKPIIEDCAQALGSKLNDRLAGSMGFAAFFSFRLGKYLSAGEGAAIITGQPDLYKRIIQLVDDMSNPTRGEEITHVISTYLRSKLRSKPLWGIAGSSIWRIYNKKTDFIDKSPIVVSKIFKSDIEIARHRMADLNDMIKVQRENAAYYIKNLKLDPSMLCQERDGAYYNRFMFPIVFGSEEQCDSMGVRLKNKGISTSKPYVEAIEGAKKHYGYNGDCPEAERLLRRTLVIPCHYKLTAREVEYIAESFNKSWLNIAHRDSRNL
jgi:perosamine synthetase